MKFLSSKYSKWNIIYEGSVKLTELFSWKLKNIEKKQLFTTDSSSSPIYQPVFIIGLPRTGSTFLYQLITNRYNVSYFDNLFDIMHKFPLSGMYYSNLIYGDKPHNCFRSTMGGTLRYGLHCPSEAGNYWYRFFERNKYRVLPEDLSQDLKKQLKLEFITILNRYKKPLVIKNLANSLRLILIKELFPKAKIIVINRKEQDVFNSILKVRKIKSIKANDFWSIYPPEIDSVKYNNEKELICSQIRSLEEQISKDIKIFPQNNVLMINYEEIINSLGKALGVLDEFMGAKLRNDALLPYDMKK